MADVASFTLKLIDKFSGRAKGASGSAGELAAALDKIESKTVNVSAKTGKMDKAVKAVQFASYAAQAGFYGSKLFDAVGGLQGIRSFAMRAKPKLAAFGRTVGRTARRVAPFAVGGAGLYGLGKIASGITLPAIAGVGVGLGAMALAAGAAALGVAAVAKRVASATAGLVVFGQNSRLAFSQLAKHGVTAGQLFDHVRGLAERFGLDVKSTTKQYQKFLALQFSPKEADKLIKMGADLQVLGNTADDVRGIFLALGQIKSKGRLQGEELLQLQERGISGQLVNEAIAKRMGVEVDQVAKLQAAGKVKADIALPAIEDAIKQKLQISELGEAGAKFADTTIMGMLGRIRARGTNLGVDLAERIEGGLTRSLGRISDSIFGFLESDRGVAMVDALARGFGAVGAIIEKAMPLVGAFTDGLLKGGGEALDAILKSAKPLMSLFAGDGKTAAMTMRMLGKSLGAAAVLAAAFGAAVIGVSSAIGVMVGAGASLFLGILDPIASRLKGISLFIGDIAFILTNSKMTFGEKAYELGAAIVRGIARGIKSLAMLPFDAIKSVADGIINTFKAETESHSPSRLFEREGGRPIPQGIARGIAHEAPVVAAAMARHLDMLSLFGGGVPGIDLGVIGPRTSAATLGAASLAGAAVFSVTANFGDINVGGDAAENPREVAEAAKRGARRGIEDFFAQLELEA